MPGPKPGGAGNRVRQGGGFNQLAGEIGDENLESSAKFEAMQQKAAAQESATPQAKPLERTQAPTSIPGEFLHMGKDVVTGSRDFLISLVGLSSEPSDPEQAAKRAEMHKRWDGLSAKQQEVAKKAYQEKIEEEQQAQADKDRKEQLKARVDQGFHMPSSPQKGPVGPAGSKKQKTVQKLQQDRQQMGGPNSL